MAIWYRIAITSFEVKMLTRRGFLGILSGALAHQATRRIYVLPPAQGWGVSPGETLFILRPEAWTYRYVYRNMITGHTSDASPSIAKLAHTFAYPESDVIDVYRHLTDGVFVRTEKYVETITDDA